MIKVAKSFKEDIFHHKFLYIWKYFFYYKKSIFIQKTKLTITNTNEIVIFLLLKNKIMN